MAILSYATYGFQGKLVSVEVDIRSGLPATEIVGLPGDAVREAKQRVRVAITNAGFEYPLRRVLVNLAPAGLRKAGAAFDLAIALSILLESGQGYGGHCAPILALGELELSGRVRSVPGVLAAVGCASAEGVRDFIVPSANYEEAAVLESGNVWPVDNVRGAVMACLSVAQGRRSFGTAAPFRGDFGTDRAPRPSEGSAKPIDDSGLDFADMRGQLLLKRAVEVAAAGGHNILLFGAQGVGKTMAALRLPSILPPLSRGDALAVTRLHSLAGVLPQHAGMIRYPGIRTPHHSASLEGMLGGGRTVVPGEVSLAHKGVLFLDEATEYRRNVLQALREPCESGVITVVRAGQNHRFPAEFQLVAAMNPCPCGNLGHPDRQCLCSFREVERYWKRFGGPLLDRMDMRVWVRPEEPELIVGEGYGGSDEIRAKVLSARRIQERRFADRAVDRNSRMGPQDIATHCSLTPAVKSDFIKVAKKLLLSTRATVSVLKVARTIADLSGDEYIGSEHVLEAASYRRWGDLSSLVELSRC